MSTITKEQLITQAQENVAQWRDAMQHNVNTEYAAIRLRLAEIALASLEAEPIYQCEFCHHDGNGELQWHWEDVNKDFYDQYDPERRGKRRIIYTAPPAPVSVPECFVRFHEIIKNRHHGRMPEEVQIAFDECDALLQGADGTLTNEDAKRVGELVMWVKRLAHSLRKANPDSKLQIDAMDYLNRKGLIGVEDMLR